MAVTKAVGRGWGVRQLPFGVEGEGGCGERVPPSPASNQSLVKGKLGVEGAASTCPRWFESTEGLRDRRKLWGEQSEGLRRELGEHERSRSSSRAFLTGDVWRDCSGERGRELPVRECTGTVTRGPWLSWAGL